MTRIITCLYALLGAMELWAEYSRNESLRYMVKPLLMPVLIAYFVMAVRSHNTISKLMVAAFVFSWIGDVALLFTDRGEQFFLSGLLGFLITHLLYAAAFQKVDDSGVVVSLLKRKPWILLPLAAYFICLMLVVFPPIPAVMKLPVAVYSTAIAIMVVTAVNRYKRVPDSSYVPVLAGAFMFMLSDSLIAIDKFRYHGELCLAGVAIMALYITGQYLIARGMSGNE